MVRPATSRPPRILRIITRLNVGGPAMHVLLVDRGLQERGWETRLLHGDVEPDEAEIDLSAAGVPMRRIASLGRSIRPAADSRTVAAIASEIRRFRPDIVHTHLSKAGMVGRAAAMLATRAPRVHTFHGTVFGGYFSRRMSVAIQQLERQLGHRTARVIALSERQRAELVEHRIAPADRIRIVPLGLDLTRFGSLDRAAARARLGIGPDELTVLALGRLVPIKRLDRAVRAFAAIATAHPAARLRIVGDGSERANLEALVEESGIRDRVSFVGWSSDSPTWYAAADVVILTSEREGTPLALIEAAAAARPVVATDAGGVADVVEDGVTGFVTPRENPDLFAQRLSTLLGDVELRARFGAAGQAGSGRWSAGRLVTDLQAVYRELLRARGTHEQH
jgi:glycosyltransferase involved in cell wall biosynthesis